MSEESISVDSMQNADCTWALATLILISRCLAGARMQLAGNHVLSLLATCHPTLPTYGTLWRASSFNVSSMLWHILANKDLDSYFNSSELYLSTAWLTLATVAGQ